MVSGRTSSGAQGVLKELPIGMLRPHLSRRTAVFLTAKDRSTPSGLPVPTCAAGLTCARLPIRFFGDAMNLEQRQSHLPSAIDCPSRIGTVAMEDRLRHGASTCVRQRGIRCLQPSMTSRGTLKLTHWRGTSSLAPLRRWSFIA